MSATTLALVQSFTTCGQTSSTVVVAKATTVLNIAAPAPVGNTIHGRATLGG